MRLLEPLNGIKMGQGHYIIHFYLFVTMFFINTELDIDLKSFLSAETAAEVEAAQKKLDEEAKKHGHDDHHEPDHHLSMISDEYEAPGYWQPARSTGLPQMKELF